MLTPGAQTFVHTPQFQIPRDNPALGSHSRLRVELTELPILI